MFTGIIEQLGVVTALRPEKNNLHITLKADFARELKIDQSVAHNGVCLTVVKLMDDDQYTVTAIKETMDKSNLGKLHLGDAVNLERCLSAQSRFDGHIVQGHVDTTGICTQIDEVGGSWYFHFEHPSGDGFVTVPKGSITINGTSLTVVDSTPNSFSVAIIPYTYAHTNFKSLKVGSTVNLEFDIVGKYVSRLMGPYKKEA